MTAMVATQANSIAAQQINSAMLADFVSYIDRCDKTTRTYLANLKQFMAWLRFSGITAPTRQDVIAYREWLSAEHDAITFAPECAAGFTFRTDSNGKRVRVSCKATTVKGYLQSVKAFFSWAAANGLYPNIAVNVHAPKIADTHKRDSLTASEVFEIENSIADKAAARTEAAAAATKDKNGRTQRSSEQGKRLYAMYLLAVNAGLRTIEISRANVKDIETKGGKSCIYIWGKGRTAPDQKKPIAPEVKAALDDYLNSRTDNPTGSSPLFVSTGNRSKGKRIAPTTISTMLKQAMVDAGYDSERLTAHSLRHSTAQNVMQITGNNIYQTQQYLRHSSPKTTEVYLENDTAEQDDRIAKQLYDLYHGGTGHTNEAETLQTLIASLSAQQIERLAAIAAAMQ